MPDAAIHAVPPITDLVRLVIAVESSNQTNHLAVFQSGFKSELVVSNTGICFSCLNDPVQDVFSVFSLIEWKVIFMQFL